MPNERNSEARAITIPRLNKAPTADDYNTLRHAVIAPNRGVNSPRQTPMMLLSNQPVQMVITDEAGDYLICDSWDGATQGGEQFIVAKPYLLQQSTLDGQTDAQGNSYAFTGIDAVTVTNGTDTEDWEVTMDYNIGDLIYAAGSIRGGIDCPTAAADYIDLNIDGRAWAKV